MSNLEVPMLKLYAPEKKLEKEQFLIEKYSKWMSGDITRQQFVFAVSYKHQPLVKWMVNWHFNDVNSFSFKHVFNRLLNDFKSARFNLLVPSPEKGGGLAVSCKSKKIKVNWRKRMNLFLAHLIPKIQKIYWRKRNIGANVLWRKWTINWRKRKTPVIVIWKS